MWGSVPTIDFVSTNNRGQALTPVALLVMWAAVLTSVMNASMSSIVLPDVQDEFGVSDDVLSWFVTAFLIPFATGMLVYGRLADMRGTRGLLLFGTSVFCVGSFFVALSSGFEMAVAGRVVQGLGATAIPALAMATIVRTTDNAGRGRAIGTLLVAVGLGLGLGPLVGGALTEWIGWKGPFIVTGLSTLVLLPPLAFALPRVQGTPGQHFDIPGAVLLTSAITGGVIAVNRLPNDTGDVYGVVGIAALVPLLALFALRTRFAREPFVDPRLLRNARFVALCVVGMCVQGSHFAVVVMLPLLLERYQDLRIIEIGAWLLPGATVLAICGVASGRLATRIGSRPLLIGGTWMLFNGAAILVLAGAGWGPVGVAAVYAVIAGGYGTANAVVVHTATGDLPADRTGVGVGVFNVAFFLGGAVAVAAVGGLLRLREGEPDAWIGLFQGAPVEFSDAGLVVAGMAAVAFVLTMLVGGSSAPERDEGADVTSAQARLVARQKPNKVT